MEQKLIETIDLRDEWIRSKYRGFLPLVNDHILGLRYFSSSFNGNAQKFEMTVMTDECRPTPVELARPGESFNIMPAGRPHHVKGVFGYWHINEQDELYIPVPIANGDSVVVVLEGLPSSGRWDRFAQYCQRCHTKIYEKAVKTGDVGVGGFWKAEEDGVKEFNSDAALRTCKNCADVHPLAYITFWTLKPGTRKDREERVLW